MKLGDILKGLPAKYVAQIRQMYHFARENSFEIGWTNQSVGGGARVFVTIYPDGKKGAFERNDAASYYFYLNVEDFKRNFGTYSRPEAISKRESNTIKSFKRFMTAISNRYLERYKKGGL